MVDEQTLKGEGAKNKEYCNGEATNEVRRTRLAEHRIRDWLLFSPVARWSSPSIYYLL